MHGEAREILNRLKVDVFPNAQLGSIKEMLNAVQLGTLSMTLAVPPEKTAWVPPELTVSDEVASERLARLVETIRGISRAANLTSLGNRCEVLVEKEARRGGELLQARTRDFKTVLVPGDASMVGQ